MKKRIGSDAGIAGIDFSDDYKKYHKLSLSVMKEFGFGTKPLMEKRILEEFEALEHFVRTKENKEFDPAEMIRICTYNIVKNILFGKREDYENGFDEILTQFNIFVRSVSPTIDVAPGLLKHIPYFARQVELSIKSTSRICDIVEDDIEKLRGKSTVECFVTSYLAKVGPDYDREQLIYTARDLIGARFETTATTLLLLLIFVANNPATQKRLQNEVRSEE